MQNQDNDTPDEMLGGDPAELNAAEDNDRIAGLRRDPRGPDTGAEQRNIDGSAMYDWQAERRSEAGD